MYLSGNRIEAGSWLLMATDLFPFSPNSMHPSSGLNNDGDFWFERVILEKLGQDYLGWDTTNPYEDSMLSSFSLPLPDSSTDSVDGASSLNLVALPPEVDSMKPSSLPYGDTAQAPNVVNSSMAPPSSVLQPRIVGSSSVPYSYPYVSQPLNFPGEELRYSMR